jgi:hypothetical protein
MGTDAQSEQSDDDPQVIAAAMASLSPEDRAIAKQQKICPVTGDTLGALGRPVKVDLNGKSVFICCGYCKGALKKEPDKYLAILEAQP